MRRIESFISYLQPMSSNKTYTMLGASEAMLPHTHKKRIIPLNGSMFVKYITCVVECESVVGHDFNVATIQLARGKGLDS